MLFWVPDRGPSSPDSLSEPHSPRSVSVPIVLARFIHEANPIKRKDYPWQLRVVLIKAGHILKASGHPQITADYQALQQTISSLPANHTLTGRAGVRVSLGLATAFQCSHFICDKHGVDQGSSFLRNARVI